MRLPTAVREGEGEALRDAQGLEEAEEMIVREGVGKEGCAVQDTQGEKESEGDPEPDTEAMAEGEGEGAPLAVIEGGAEAEGIEAVAQLDPLTEPQALMEALRE